jgi:hypothetical protein
MPVVCVDLDFDVVLGEVLGLFGVPAENEVGVCSVPARGEGL